MITDGHRPPLQVRARTRVPRWTPAVVVALISAGGSAVLASEDKDRGFHDQIEPVLTEYCYDCHAEGTNKGKVSFDEFKSPEEMLAKRDLWLAVLKNVRAGLMPPEKKPRPSDEQKKTLERWIKSEVFAIDPENPDPGRVTIRRLNRVEYRNTIRDLTGFDFKVDEELPPDDTGYGFDNIGDVLTVSPLLLEKYMQAAETIVAGAVPRVAKMVAERTIPGAAFSSGEAPRKNERFSFYDAAAASHSFAAEQPGTYHLTLEFEVDGQFDFDPGRCRAVFKVDDLEVWQNEFVWQNRKRLRFQVDQTWEAGSKVLKFEVQPLVPVEQKKNALNLRLLAVRVEGPTEPEHWVRPKNFSKFFTNDVPETAGERRQYARELLTRFATRAFRRPVDENSVERLVAVAERASSETGRSFEDGIAQAIVPVLASPRFLFRVEETEPAPSEKIHPFVDEYALASRLSYFLWSTMPDDELFELAQRGELRKNLPAQVQRMLKDSRSAALIENFVGQWLQVRDVEGIDINAPAVLARDRGQEGDFRRSRQRLEELRAKTQLTPEEEVERDQLIEQARARFRNRRNIELDGELRRALRQESEMTFAYVMREDRSILELIDSDYTFLNERLAKHYGLTQLPDLPEITGEEMRRVTLPPDNPRGGVLTQGSVLIVTSNPTRTSPVKRGLFILDNILGSRPPPPPPNIPNLEDAEREFKGRDPTLRETLEVHRKNTLCSSCHNRMDPLGLALENFNALGMWRDKERGQPIDARGKLITGEEFQDIREVKRVLADKHQNDFYQCLTEKLLTYALGRGLEYYDVYPVDQIVERLQKENGRFSVLLTGIIDSAPFQKRRNPNYPRDSEPGKEFKEESKTVAHR